MAASAKARQRREAKEGYRTARRPAIVPIAGALMIITGILGLSNSYLILASSIVWGWLISGIIGLITLGAGIGLFRRADWAYDVAINMAILNLFVGFIAFLGAFDVRYAILGWTGIGQGIGISIFILALISVILLSRREVRHYFLGFI